MLRFPADCASRGAVGVKIIAAQASIGEVWTMIVDGQSIERRVKWRVEGFAKTSDLLVESSMRWFRKQLFMGVEGTLLRVEDLEVDEGHPK